MHETTMTHNLPYNKDFQHLFKFIYYLEKRGQIIDNYNQEREEI